MGVALVLIYPCGKAQNSPPGAALKTPLLQSLLQPPPFPLALDDPGSVLAVKGPLAPLRALDCSGPIRRDGCS